MFTTPPQGFNPEIVGVGVPQEFSSSPVDPETRYQLFEKMQQQVETNTLSQDHASWLLQVAFGDIDKARSLMHRFNRPGGFNGNNYWTGGIS